MIESKPSDRPAAAMTALPAAMAALTARTASWIAVSIIALLLCGIGVFLGGHINSAIDTATVIARPHEVQAQLEHVKVTLDALQDSLQDFMIDGANGMRIQY